MDLSKYLAGVNDLLAAADARILSIRRDPEISREAKIREISRQQQDFREKYAGARKGAEDYRTREALQASRRAYPAEKISGDNQAQIAREMRRARIRDDLEATWKGRNGGPTLEEYRAAVASGDELAIEVLEVYGPVAIGNEDMKSQYVRAVEGNRSSRMSDDQRAALRELEALKKAEMELRVALSFKDDAARRISDTPVSQLADSAPPAA